MAGEKLTTANLHEVRQAVPMLRRWCPMAKTHQDVDDETCGWEHEDLHSTHRNHNHAGHRLRLRRMIVCSICQQGYFNQEEWDRHECWDAY